MQKYVDLRVWQTARELVKEIYVLTEAFPERERFGLTNQIRRAVVSIAANIAEGAKRRSANDYARFLNISEGSAAELSCLIILAQDLNYCSEETAKAIVDKIDDVERMLFGLRNKVTSP
jgi:four helix bundle protein